MMVKLGSKITVSLSDLWVNRHDRLSDFYASSWQRGETPIPLLVMRMVLAAIAISILSWSVADGGSSYWLIFLTNWGVLLVTFLMISGVGVSLASTRRKSFETTQLPWYVSIYWVLLNVTVTLSIMITALYWSLLYAPGKYLIPEYLNLTALDVSTHGITSCVAFAELLLSRSPVRLLHIYQPLGMGLVYAIFTGIYYGAGGTDSLGNRYIYTVLNWHENPAGAGIVLSASVAALIILYLVIYGIGKGRDQLSLWVVRTTSHDFPPTPPDKHTRIV